VELLGVWMRRWLCDSKNHIERVSVQFRFHLTNSSLPVVTSTPFSPVEKPSPSDARYQCILTSLRLCVSNAENAAVLESRWVYTRLAA